MKTSRLGAAIALFALILFSIVFASSKIPLFANVERFHSQNQTNASPFTTIAREPHTKNKVGVSFLSDPPPWAKDAEDIMAELENWRGQSFVRPLEIQIKPREADEPAGWYSPETQQLIVTSNGSENFRRGVMLHEIFHALQDQTFDLLTLHQAAETEDADQALDALIEGEAMLAVSDLLNYDFATHAKLPAEGEISDALFNRLFEYGDGMMFVRSRRDSGEWEAVNQAFRKPPQSTAEIYHPETYPVIPREITVGEYGFRLWLARSPKTRSHLNDLSDAYQSDQLTVSESGQQTWQIELKNKAWVTTISQLAPDAIAMMPNSPQSYDVSENGRFLTITWNL